MVGVPEGEAQEEEFGAAMDTDSGMDGKVKKIAVERLILKCNFN